MSSTPTAGALVGRYVVLDELGRGGGGRVHVAFDTELERKVALKLLRREGSSNEARREARALAKLAHPHVVSIYDVGEADGHAFIAMELMSGESFEAFAADAAADVLLSALCDVAEAVAAAHDADLIHGDIKPSNILRTTDGRTKLSDFGVARSLGGADTGLAGTQAFMAPELFEGQRPSPASDQYAFCLTAWSAFHGRAPAPAHEETEAESASRGAATGPEVEAASERSVEPTDFASTARHGPWEVRGLPNKVVAALSRGLDPDPSKRWPSMRALIEAVRPRPARRGRAAWALGAALVLGGGAWGLTAAADDSKEPCAHARDPVARVWTHDRRTQVHAALDAPGFAQVRDDVTGSIDDYAQTWASGSHDACVATHVQQTQSARALDLRGACLRDALAGLEATLEVLAIDDAQTRLHAHELVHALPPVDACADVSTLIAQDGDTPITEAQRERSHAVRAELKRVEALRIAGKFSEASALLSDLESEVAALGTAAITVEHAVAWAEVERGRGRFPAAAEHAERALTQALSSKDTRELDEILGLLSQLHGFELGHHERAKAYTQMLLAHTSDLDGAPRSSALAAVSVQRVGSGAYLEAIELLREALALREADRGQDIEYASMLNDLAISLDFAGKYAESIATHEQAVALRRTLLGDRHPSVAQTLDNLAQAHMSAGDAPTSLRIALEAQAILRETTDPNSTLLAMNANTRGNALAGQERWEESAEALEEAQRGLLKTLPESHPTVATVRNGLGIVYDSLGREDEAIAVMRAALDAQVETMGAQHPSLVVNRTNFGVTLSRVGRHDEALEHLRKSTALGSEALGQSHADSLYARTQLARALLRAQAWDEARREATRTLMLYEGVEHAPSQEIVTLKKIRDRATAEGSTSKSP